MAITIGIVFIRVVGKLLWLDGRNRALDNVAGEDFSDEIHDGIASCTEPANDLESRGGRELFGARCRSLDLDKLYGLSVQRVALTDDIAFGEDILGYGAKVEMIEDGMGGSSGGSSIDGRVSRGWISRYGRESPYGLLSRRVP